MEKDVIKSLFVTTWKGVFRLAGRGGLSLRENITQHIPPVSPCLQSSYPIRWVRRTAIKMSEQNVSAEDIRGLQICMQLVLS